MAKVSQRFIDLLNAPISVLRGVASRNEVKVTGKSKSELAQQLAHLDRSTLEDETGQFLYAGSTALSWLRLVPEDEEIDEDDPAAHYPIRGVELERDKVVAGLQEQSEGNPFSESDRPDEITTRPKLIVAREWDEDDGYMLTFALAKRTGHVIHNFEDIPVYEDEFFNALLRPGAGSVEVRASSARADRLARTWLTDFAGILGTKVVPVAITSSDYKDLHRELKARLDVFRGRTTTGTTVFDTHEFTKAEAVIDLLVEQEFTTATSDLEPVSMDLLFDVDGFEEVRMHVSVLNGSLYIRTAVPEGIVRYVRDVLERIKAAHGGP